MADDKPAPHPAPWRLIPEHDREYEGDSMGRIEDASGVVLCDFGDATQYYPSEGHPPEEPVATLMLAAPELELGLRFALDVVREAVDDGWRPKSQDIGPGCAKARALLARIDAAADAGKR